MKTLAAVTMLFLPGTFVAVSLSFSPCPTCPRPVCANPDKTKVAICNAAFQLECRRHGICDKPSSLDILGDFCATYAFDRTWMVVLE